MPLAAFRQPLNESSIDSVNLTQRKGMAPLAENAMNLRMRNGMDPPDNDNDYGKAPATATATATSTTRQVIFLDFYFLLTIN